MRYPFRHAVDRYIREYSGVLSTETLKMRIRGYRRIADCVEFLHSEGSTSTQDPHRFTVHDVREVAVYLKGKGLAPSTLNTEISLLQNILMFCGNDSVRLAKVRYPSMLPKQVKGGEDLVDPAVVERILFEVNNTVSVLDLHHWMPCVIALSTGARLNEFRNMRAEDFDLVGRRVRVSYPKGFESWGRVRTVPIRPEFYPAVRRWVDFIGSGYLFSRPYEDVPVSRNTLTRYRRDVCDKLHCDFDYRMCRRTYGQSMIDEGVPLEVVSVLLGHARTDTTDVFYARVRNSSAVESVLDRWSMMEGLAGRIGYEPDEKKSSAEREI